jgi:hypothetical protein
LVDKRAGHVKIQKLTWTGSSMVEQLTLNQRVAGSSPARFTKSPIKQRIFTRLAS